MATKAKTPPAEKAAPAAKAPGTALAKTKAQLPANIQEQYANEIAELQKRLSAPTGNRIAVTQGKTLKLPNGMEVDEIECVVVDFVAASFYYPGIFDRNSIVPPDCFAIGLEPAGLIPSDNSPDKQCEACAGCWANQFKSAHNKRGKACSNNRILALLPLDADDTTPLQILKVSSTGLKSFDAHVGTCASKYGVPVRGVVTKIAMSDEEYPSLRFSVVEKLKLSDPLVAIAQGAKEDAMRLLTTEPDVTPAAEETKTKAPLRRAAPAKKVAGARR